MKSSLTTANLWPSNSQRHLKQQHARKSLFGPSGTCVTRTAVALIPYCTLVCFENEKGSMYMVWQNYLRILTMENYSLMVYLTMPKG